MSADNGPRPLPGPGTIGVVAAYNARYTVFTESLMGTMYPPGTQCHFSTGLDVVDNCERLASEFNGEWLWMLGDDHTWEPDLLLALLAHEVDIVVPLVTSKAWPFRPVVFEHEVAGSSHKYRSLQLTGRSGLVPVAAAGTAGMLIRRRVFERLEQPYFTLPFGSMQKLSEDVFFCRQAREAGFDIHCDLDRSMGHIGPCQVSAERDEHGEWVWKFAFGSGGFYERIPDAMANPEGRSRILVP